jgi:hypothetical protein
MMPRRFQILVLAFLAIISLELAVIAVKLPSTRAQAQGRGPLPVTLVGSGTQIGCPGSIGDWCAKVESDGALLVRVLR